MEWIKWNGEEIDKGNYIVCTANKVITEMKYTWNAYAKTKRGQQPRWEWHGKLSPWEITHYMNLPKPPTE